MQNIKIKQTNKTLDLTRLALERQARQQLKANHSLIWLMLYKIFVLDDSMTIQEFKKDFAINVFLRLPILLMLVFWVMFMAQILGGMK